MRNALAIRPLSFAALAFLLAEGIGCDSSQPCELGPYQDPAPHQAGRIEISDGMQLHYLDFGGTGPALLLLAGAGDSAHVFDDFAPRLTDAFRVLALTRRGFGESDRPATGYDTGTLAGDIAGFLEAAATRFSTDRSAALNSATTRPRSKTIARWQTLATSSKSVDTIRMAAPFCSATSNRR